RLVGEKRCKLILVHRLVWALANQRWPEEIDHLCRNRACCRLEHLEEVSHAVNVKRGLQGIRGTRCKRGHLFVERNHRDHGSESRNVCLTCQRRRSRKWHRQHRKEYNVQRRKM